MKLTKIKIEKFRSIKKSSINISGITALVGGNNCGKSSILLALNSFFNFEKEKHLFENKRHNYSQGSKAKVECWFELGKVNTILTPLLHGGFLKIKFEFDRKKGRANYQAYNGSWTQLSDNQNKILFESIGFVLIPPVRDHNQFTNQNDAVLREIVEMFIQNKIQRRNDIKPKVDKLAQEIEDNIFKKLNKSICDKMPFDMGITPQINITNQVSIYDVIGNFKFKMTDNGQLFEVEDFGNGVQSATIIGLYRLLAELKHKRYIIGIEEPETNLHPRMQVSLVNSIKKSNAENTGIQSIIATHSPSIINELEHHEIALSIRQNERTRAFSTCSHQIGSDFFVQNNLDKERHYNFYRKSNSEFFFAKHVFVVEGPTDEAIIKHLAKISGADLALYGISILTMGGIKSFSYPFSLLSELGIPFSVIADKDFFFNYQTEINPQTEKEGIRRQHSGFPLYQRGLKNDAHVLLSSRGFNVADIKSIGKKLYDQYSLVLPDLLKHNIVPMNYNLEADLLATEQGLHLMAQAIRLTDPNNARVTDVIFNKKSKHVENLVFVLDNIEKRSMPYSYKYLKQLIEKHCG